MTAYENDRLLTRFEVEQHFGIPKRYLETCVARGEGPPIVRIGRLARYRTKDIQEWITANTTGLKCGAKNE